jgi:hypothetical protein
MRSCITLLASMFFISGCMANNGRCWVKGNIEFYGDKRASDNRIFTGMQIGVPCKPMKSLPDIAIEFPDGAIVPLCDIDLSYLEKRAKPVDRFYYDRQNRNFYGCTWPDDVKVFEILSYTFAANQDKLVCLSSQRCTGILWNRNKTIRHTFPLSEDDLQDLFGRPDWVYDYFRGTL